MLFPREQQKIFYMLESRPLANNFNKQGFFSDASGTLAVKDTVESDMFQNVQEMNMNNVKDDTKQES